MLQSISIIEFIHNIYRPPITGGLYLIFVQRAYLIIYYINSKIHIYLIKGGKYEY
jgi:hypothetical protein